MVWFLIAQIFSTLISLIQIGRMSESDKDLKIMVLRYQLGIAERKMQKPVRANRAEKMTLAVLAGRLKKQTNRPANQFRHLIRLVQPETVFRWHRDLVRHKWTQESRGKRGRPRIDDQVESLIVRFAKENLRRRSCDFFVVESLFLKTYYCLFFIEIGTRRVHLADVTPNPNGQWVAQQARQYVCSIEEREETFRCLIHDGVTFIKTELMREKSLLVIHSQSIHL